MQKLTSIFVLYFMMILSGCSAQNTEGLAKLSCQKVFTLSHSENYDSLKSILPAVFIGNPSVNFLRIKFKDFRKLVDIEGVPDTSMFHLSEKKLSESVKNEFEMIYIPKTDSLKIDSIAFRFDKSHGVHQIALYTIYNPRVWDNIKTEVSPALKSKKEH